MDMIVYDPAHPGDFNDFLPVPEQEKRDESMFWVILTSVIVAGVIIYCTSKLEEQKMVKLKTDKPEPKRDDKCLSIIGY